MEPDPIEEILNSPYLPGIVSTLVFLGVVLIFVRIWMIGVEVRKELGHPLPFENLRLAGRRRRARQAGRMSMARSRAK